MSIQPTEDMKKLLDQCVAWYKIDGNQCGGCLHGILDDDNVDDYFILSVIMDLISYPSIEDNTELRIEAANILTKLYRLREAERLWITYNIYNVLENDPIRYDIDEDTAE
jgi:hypothetical protein